MTLLVSESQANVVPLTIRLFGPMQVLVHGQPLPHLRSRKALWLLALLTLRHGRPVQRDWLAGVLWPEVNQTQGFANLRPTLSQLRTALGSEAERLQSPNRQSLILDLAGADVDIAAFDAAIGRKAPSDMEHAVNLYRGILLEGCVEEWVVPEREKREQDCLRALETLATIAAHAGKHGAATDYWRRAVVLDPFGEAPRRGLMEALFRAGDTNAAIQVYREFVSVVQSGDLRAVPGEETTALYRRLREQVRQKAATTSISSKEETPLPRVSGYLPHALTELVGREDERLEVAERLRQSRLVTLTGPGGIGKTRLAIAVANEVVREYPDGVWLVGLESLPSNSNGSSNEGIQSLIQQIASVLRVKEATGHSLLDTMLEHLRQKRLLIVLDNCEHLADSCAEIVSTLLQECLRVRILATSRETLRISGETVWPVPTLAAPDPDHLPFTDSALARALAGFDAVRLFTERAEAANKSFALTRLNARDVALLCARLDGNPLALELAAARTVILAPAEIIAQLDARPLDALASRHRDIAPRHRTLRAVLEWSFGILPSEAQVFLSFLGVFRGGWTLEAAQAIHPDADTIEMLTILRNASLINADIATGENPRYTMLETVRQYAVERLETGGNAARVKERHADWYLSLSEEAAPHLHGPEQQQWMRRLATEQDNFRVALDWSATNPSPKNVSLRIASALCRFWSVRGDYTEGRRFLTQALDSVVGDGREDLDTRAKGLIAVGGLAIHQGDPAAALVAFEEAMGICRELGDKKAIATLLHNLAVIASTKGDYVRARALYEEKLSISRALGDKRGIAAALGNLGNIAFSQDDPTSARVLYEQCIHLYRELGDTIRIQYSLVSLANAASAQGDHLMARSLAEESLILARAAGGTPAIVESLLTLGYLFWARDDLVGAQSYFEESLSLSRAIGNLRLVGWALLGLGETNRAQSNLVSAHELHTEGLSIFRAIGERRGEGWALFCLGAVALNQGDFASSRALCQESVAILHAIKDKEGQARSLGGLAMAMLRQGSNVHATRLFAASEALCDKYGTIFPLRVRRESDQQVSNLRVALGESAFTEAWTEGYALIGEQAAIYAASLSETS